MDMAYKIAQIRPAGVNDLLPEFNETFEVMSKDIPGSMPLLGNDAQRLILEYKDYMPEGLKLSVNREGVWLSCEDWLDKEQAVQMVKLCDELLQKMKKGV